MNKIILILFFILIFQSWTKADEIKDFEIEGMSVGDSLLNHYSEDQILKNIEVKDKSIINKPEIKKSIKLATKLIRGNGRVLVRKSGTEPKIRIMGESKNKVLLKKCINMISKAIK